MDIRGHPWISTHGYPWMDLHGCPWIFMDIHGYPMDIHGYPLICIDFHGYPSCPWLSICLPRISAEIFYIHRNQGKSIDIYGYPLIFNDIHGFSLIPVLDIYGYHGYPCISMDSIHIHWYPWISLDSQFRVEACDRGVGFVLSNEICAGYARSILWDTDVLDPRLYEGGGHQEFRATPPGCHG